MENKSIIIDQIEYQISGKITMNILQIITNNIEPYETRVAEAMLCAIISETKPPMETILEIGDSIFEQYIRLVIESNEKYSDYYNERTDDICEKFCNYIINDNERIRIEISKIFLSNISTITKQIADSFKPVGLALSRVAEQLRPSSEYFRELAKQFNDFDWSAREQTYQQWGKFGWTIIDNAGFNFFDESPGENADEMAMEFLTNYELSLIFEGLRNRKINIGDLESAITCFKLEQYKACALILCAMIDAEFIKRQPLSDREVGKRALKKYREGEGLGIKLDEKPITYLLKVNTLAYLNEIFKYGDNFDPEKEPNVLNRNYLGHGMSTRTVTNIDCIKLFLGLDNTILLLSHS